VAVRDLKGFDHAGVAWAWPDFDELGNLLRPGHAWASLGMAKCGEPWPHVFDRQSGQAMGTPLPDGTFPKSIVPTKEIIERCLRPEDKRSAYLCRKCLRALGLPAQMGGLQ